MDTKAIRCFEAVYEEQSINQAARQLFISPQGLSKIISHLEAELDTVLFERTRTGMIPTESGIYLYSQTHQILYMLDHLKVNLKQMKDCPETVRLGLAYGTVNVFSPELFLMSRREEPRKHIRIDWTEESDEELIQDILNGRIDIGCAVGPVNHPDLSVIELFRCNVDVIVYEGHPLYHHSCISVEDLRNEPLICLNEKYSIYHSLLRRCNDFCFTPDIAIKTFDSQLIYRFTREHMGLGIDVDIHKGTDLLHSLHRIAITDAVPWVISAVCRKDRKSDTSIAEVLAILNSGRSFQPSCDFS